LVFEVLFTESTSVFASKIVGLQLGTILKHEKDTCLKFLLFTYKKILDLALVLCKKFRGTLKEMVHFTAKTGSLGSLTNGPAVHHVFIYKYNH
jgi:hypothetical protein